MAPGIDSAGPAGGGGASQAGSSGALSWTHTVAAGPCLLLVACSPDNMAPASPATCKLDPAGANLTMTSLGTVPSGAGGTAGFLQVFWIGGVASGAHTIAVTPGGYADDLTAGARSRSPRRPASAPW